MRTRLTALALAVLAAAATACSPASPDDSGTPAGCVTDFSCPSDEECGGAGCVPISSGLYPHIQTASALLRPYLDSGEMVWRATHYDLLIGQIDADALRAENPKLRLFEYLNTRYLVEKTAASQWAQTHGQDIEDFYLHFKEDTSVPTYETRVIVPGFPPGVVPGYNPGGGGNPASATTRAQSRVPGFNNYQTEPWYLANVDNTGYRRFLEEHVAELIDGSYWGSRWATGPVSGVMCDVAIFYPLFNEGELVHSTEYYGVPMTDDHPYALAFASLYPEMAGSLFNAFSATKDVMPNYGHVLYLNYPNRAADSVKRTTPWIWPQVWVTYNGLWSPTTGGNRCITYERDYTNAVAEMVRQTRAGARRVLGSADISNGTIGTDRGRLFLLGLYYLVHNARTYYMYDTSTGTASLPGHISTWSWNPAVTYDVGQPDAVPLGTLDFEGKANTKQHYVFATGPDPYNPALTYRVLARRFTGALVLVKMLPDGSVTDDRSITTHALDGSYAVLQADGSLGAVITDAQIRNNEALILIPLN